MLSVYILTVACTVLFHLSEANVNATEKTVTDPVIVGGYNAGPREWRWQARLTKGGRHFCGGTLIHRQYVLTAAHCVCDTENGGQRYGSESCSRPFSGLRVHLGDYRISRRDPYEMAASISRVWVNNRLYDAAVLKLRSPVSTNTYRKTIPLGCSTPRAGTSLWTTGWGRTSGYSSRIPDVLQEIQLKVMSSCPDRRTICVNKPGWSYKGVCMGDSGGPLVRYRGRGSWELVGVTSAVTARNRQWCKDSQGYGLFTSVPQICGWIRSKTGSTSPPPSGSTCGSRPYNPRYYICCSDRLYRKNAYSKCCGTRAYNSRYYGCCGNRVYHKRYYYCFFGRWLWRRR